MASFAGAFNSISSQAGPLKSMGLFSCRRGSAYGGRSLPIRQPVFHSHSHFHFYFYFYRAHKFLRSRVAKVDFRWIREPHLHLHARCVRAAYSDGAH